MAVDEMYLDNIEEFVYDENRIVTYKGLSLSLGVHVNQAKQMLYSFVQHQRNEKDKDDLNVFYLVAGMVQSKGKKVCKVQLVPEEQLSVVKSSHSPLISCHVYSVQKQKLRDPNTLYTADHDLIRDHILQSNQYSAITCQAAQPRSQDDIDQLRERMSSKGLEACTPRQNGSSKSSKPAGIAGMFAGAPKQAKSQKNDSKHKPNGDSLETKNKSPEKENNKTKPKQGGVMSFFAKQATKPKAEKKEESKSEESKSEEAEMIIDDSDEEVQPKQTKKEAQKGRKKKVESDDDDDQIAQKKKRRRVQACVSSSEEDEEDEDEDVDEEPIPPSPPAAPREPSPPKQDSPVKEERPTTAKKGSHQSTENGSEKKYMRKRKLVSKTYVNDEGFMVTEKVYEDEEVEVVEVKKTSPVKDKPQEKKKMPPKKNAPKASGKQTNMMSFFKKK